MSEDPPALTSPTEWERSRSEATRVREEPQAPPSPVSLRSPTSPASGRGDVVFDPVTLELLWRCKTDVVMP
jgi:hypothetical protein